MKQAQITVYLALVFSLILSVFLSALEAARGSALKIRMENAVQTAIHSTFAEYHKELFERYGLFFIDTSYMTERPDFHKVEGRMEEYLEYNFSMPENEMLLWARDWYGVEDCNAVVTNIRLATDYDGCVLKEQAVNYIKDYVDFSLIKKVQSWMTTVETYEINGEKMETEYKEVLAQADESWSANNLLEEEWTLTKMIPSFDIDTFYIDPILALFLNNKITELSTKTFQPWNAVSYRNCLKGTEIWEPDINALTGELFFNEYILQKMGNFQKVLPESCLDYQAEYILFGSPQDTANLDYMVRALFWFRSATNFVMLISDADTQKIVNEVAKLAVFLEIPPELAAVLINICWAAAESALDVKELIDGNRVIFLKKPNEFGMSLKGLTEFDPDMFLARDVPEAEDAQGLSYEDYIRIMLAFLPPNIKILRCMDMMEADIRKTEGNENFRIDACADMVSLEVGITSSFGYFYTMERKYGYF